MREKKQQIRLKPTQPPPNPVHTQSRKPNLKKDDEEKKRMGNEEYGIKG